MGWDRLCSPGCSFNRDTSREPWPCGASWRPSMSCSVACVSLLSELRGNSVGELVRDTGVDLRVAALPVVVIARAQIAREGADQWTGLGDLDGDGKPDYAVRVQNRDTEHFQIAVVPFFASVILVAVASRGGSGEFWFIALRRPPGFLLDEQGGLSRVNCSAQGGGDGDGEGAGGALGYEH